MGATVGLSPLATHLRHYLIAHTHSAATSDDVSPWLASPLSDIDTLALEMPDAVASALTVHYDVAWTKGLELEWQSDAGFRRVGQLLEEIGQYEHERGRPHLTACCVSRASGRPGPGFTGLLGRLPGVNAEGDPLQVWRRELVRSARWWQVACPPGSIAMDSLDRVRLAYDPTAIADAHYERLTARLGRL